MMIAGKRGDRNMAKTAILMPYPALQEMAESLISRYPRLTPMCVEYVQTPQIHARAKSLEEKGCEIIIARGLQARIAREAVIIPVIEMRASTQELETMAMELKNRLPAGQEPPRMAIIGFFNMFHSTERFNELLGIDLKVYTATNIDQYSLLVDRAQEDGCLGVIGGEVVCRRAAELGMAHCFLSMGEESVREALESASLVGYSIDLIKHSNAEMGTMLDHTFTGIMQADSGGTVRRANRTCYQLLGRSTSELVGVPALSLIPGLTAEELDAVLKEGREIEASVIEINRTSVLMNIAPVLVDDQIDGAIFTFQEGKRVSEMDIRLRQEVVRRGYVAKYSFKQVSSRNTDYAALLARAKKLSKHSEPVLLYGESGVGKGILAQCMHNESLHRHGAFITVDCSIWHPEDLDGILFGRYGSRKDGEVSLVEQARGGTLYLRQVELLSMETQYKLLLLTRGQYMRNGSSRAEAIDARLIISTEANLKEKALAGAFRKDLYYILSALKLNVPALRQRREDLPALFNQCLEDWQNRFKRRLRVSPDCVDFLCGYDWPGNLDQLSSLCQRLVLLCDKRAVDEDTARQALTEMNIHAAALAADGTPAPDPRAEELMALLNRHHGSREKAAAELGISKTTLWRRMRKYGISKDLTME